MEKLIEILGRKGHQEAGVLGEDGSAVCTSLQKETQEGAYRNIGRRLPAGRMALEHNRQET